MERSSNLLNAALTQLLVDAVAAEPSTSADAGRRLSTPFSTMAQADWVEAVKLWNRHGRRLIDDVSARACPGCGSDDGQLLFRSYDGYPFHECDVCGSWYVPLNVDAALFERFFRDCPPAYEVLQRSLTTRTSDSALQADLDRFNEYFGILMPLLEPRAQLRYLDIGCGLGNSLRAATAYGMDAWGIETSPDCVRQLEMSRLQVLQGADAIAPGSFDLITFWESLEHIADPYALLLHVHRALGDTGVVAFTLPNLNSPHVRLQRADCSIVHGGYDTPGHINLFGPDQIARLMSRAGFDLLDLDGLFGSDLPELLSYMLGGHQGARSLLNGNEALTSMSPIVDSTLNAIGPPVALMERHALTTPIVMGIACKKGQRERLAAPINELRRRRHETIMAAAAAQVSLPHSGDSPDPLPMPAGSSSNVALRKFAESMEARKQEEIVRLREELAARGQAVSDTLLEVTKRDALLQLSQGEINRRDDLLSRRAQEIDALNERLAGMQGEIDRRDDLLTQRTQEMNAKSSRLVEQPREIARLQSEAAETRAALQSAQEDVARREAQLASANDAIAECERTIDQQKNEIAAMLSELTGKSNHISQLQGQIAALLEERGQLAASLQDLRFLVGPLLRPGRAGNRVNASTAVEGNLSAAVELRWIARYVRALYRRADRFRSA